MDNKERTYLRTIQDKCINHLLKTKFDMDKPICFMGPTISQCQESIYPDLKYTFEDYITEWGL